MEISFGLSLIFQTPQGHTPAQIPQPMHFDSSLTYSQEPSESSMRVIAFSGQEFKQILQSRQVPQETQRKCSCNGSGKSQWWHFSKNFLERFSAGTIFFAGKGEIFSPRRNWFIISAVNLASPIASVNLPGLMTSPAAKTFGKIFFSASGISQSRNFFTSGKKSSTGASPIETITWSARINLPSSEKIPRLACSRLWEENFVKSIRGGRRY